MSHAPGATQTERERPFASSSMILRALPAAALVLDEAGIVRQANPAAVQLLGAEGDALLGRPISALPLLAKLGADETGLIAAGERVLRFEKRPLLADEGDRAAGTIVLLEDRTAEQAALRQQYEYVCRALHDVRVPLQAVGGAAEGLLRGWFGPLTDEQREFVAMIKENAGRQGDLFSSLFDVYTLAAGHVELHTERVRLEGVLHEVAHELASRFAARTLDLALDVADELPPVEAERRRLRQMLAAMLDNACKYTLPGGSVVVRVARHGGELRADVQDTGVGIRAADQPRIFQPFFRGESPLKEGRYGGLSLAIARMLAELHGGRMWFESAEGQGSTFSLALPVAPGT